MQPVGDAHLLGAGDAQSITVIAPYAAMTNWFGAVDGDTRDHHEDQRPPKHALVNANTAQADP